MLWRGHANQGRYQPGRRAVLEETNVMSDLLNSTGTGVFSQAQTARIVSHIPFICNYIGGPYDPALDLSLAAKCLSSRSINVCADRENFGVNGPLKSCKLSKSMISTSMSFGKVLSTTSATPPLTVTKIVRICFSPFPNFSGARFPRYFSRSVKLLD
jgi:hypothetical protein